MGLNLKKAKENSNSDSKEFTPISEGRHVYTIEAGEEKESKNDNPMLEFTFRCESPEFKNRKVWQNFVLTENAQIYLIRFLEALGLKEITEKESVTEEEIIQNAVGRKVSAYTEIQTYNGKSYNNLKNFTEVKDSEASVSPKKKQLFA